MTWKEFKEMVEKRGVTENSEIKYLRTYAPEIYNEMVVRPGEARYPREIGVEIIIVI